MNTNSNPKPTEEQWDIIGTVVDNKLYFPTPCGQITYCIDLLEFEQKLKEAINRARTEILDDTAFFEIWHPLKRMYFTMIRHMPGKEITLFRQRAGIDDEAFDYLERAHNIHSRREKEKEKKNSSIFQKIKNFLQGFTGNTNENKESTSSEQELQKIR